MPLVDIASPDEMLAFGRRFGGLVRGGDVLGLVGDLGAGKTLLVKGLARGMGVPEDVPVVSPTFTLVQTYRGRSATLHHVDLYRLERAAELEDIGLDDLYRDDAAVVAVEWFDRFPEAAPREYLELRIAVTSDTSRRVELAAHGRRAEALARALLDEGRPA
jgi:tRNA threonylcarbamoyladenosine biosynthesis protein TsaE